MDPLTISALEKSDWSGKLLHQINTLIQMEESNRLGIDYASTDGNSLDFNSMFASPNAKYYCPPEPYNPHEDYRQKSSTLMPCLNKNLDSLKDICFEKQMIAMEFDSLCGITNSSQKHSVKDVIMSYKRVYKKTVNMRLRRNNKQIDKVHACPFDQCSKTYSCRSSLK